MAVVTNSGTWSLTHERAANPTRADRIVVVDDDARIRDLLRRYLTQEGFEAFQAGTARP